MNDNTIPLNVSPCLFIGLGTNGWQMIDELRKLCFEEFGRAGLPCFRYVALETDLKRMEDNSFLPHKPEQYERVRPVYITIPDLSVIATRIDQRSGADYSAGLAEWLDPSLVNRGIKSFTAGAGHHRQAGRLCLWENWNRNGNVSHELRTVISELREQRVIDDADKFLRNDYFKKKGTPTPHEDLISLSSKVYILGTLCGGTCSGTFLDIAYFVTDLLGVKNRAELRNLKHPEVVGLFTLPDTLRMHEKNRRPHVANCWAALRELDFYFQAESVYHVKFPDGHEIHNRDEPFDTVYIESMANAGKAGFAGENQLPLVQMCAMNLFTEVVAGIAGQKDKIRINFRSGDAGYLGKNSNGNIRAFSSFGLSAIWYPRYRVVNAISKQLGAEMCEGWLTKANLNVSNVDADASGIWKKVLDHARGSLVGSVENSRCAENLEADVETTFSDRLREFMAQGADALAPYMGNFPQKGATYNDRLRNPEGRDYLRVAHAEPSVSQDARKQLRDAVEQYLKEHTLPEAIALVDLLRKKIEQLNESIPAPLPVLSQNVQANLAEDVYGDTWSKLLGERSAAIREYKQALWSELKQRVLKQLVAVREHCLKSVLDHLAREVVSLREKISTLESRVDLLRAACVKQAEEQIELSSASNVIIISRAGSQSIREDVELARKDILKTKDRLSLRAAFMALSVEGPIDRFERREMPKLINEVDAAFSPFGQAVVSAFDIGKQSISTLQSKIQNLVLTSLAYVEPIASFEPLITTQSPNFIFCHDNDSATQISELARSHKTGRGFTPSSSPLDHFIFFYQELPGMAISDLQISGYASSVLIERESASDRVCTSFLHKAGPKMFDVKAASELMEFRHWIEAMAKLAPELFKTDRNTRYIEFEDAKKNYDTLVVDSIVAIQAFAEKHGIEVIMRMFKAALKAATEPVVRDKVNAQLRQAANLEEKQRLKSFYDRVLTVAFPATDGNGAN